MTMDYSEAFAQTALEQFEKPDGNPLFEHASETLRLMYTLDVHNYVTYCETRNVENLKDLFSASSPEAVESLVLTNGDEAPFGGEWFMKVFLGHNVTFSAGSKILAHGNITINDGAIIGEQAQLCTVGHPMHPRQRHLIMIGPMIIGEGAVVGGGAIVLNPGTAEAVALGRNAIVLPGSIVSRNVPDYSVVGGVNKLLLEGKEYFTSDTTDGTLAKRLNAKGMVALEEKAKATGLSLPKNVCAKGQQKLPAGVRPIDHNVTKNLSQLATFFPGASEEVLRMGLFFPPVYLAGTGQITLGNNILLNTSSVLNVDGAFVLGDGSFLAPEAEITVPEGAKVLIGKKVWLGAKVKVSAEAGQIVSIGDGSVLAAGAEVKESVPAMSVVIGNGKIVDTLSEKNIYPIPAELNVFENYENQRIRLREHIATLSIEEVKARLATQCIRPQLSKRIQDLGRKM